ncbi:hypothetical protein V1478_009377, partial [Vespula squamosa]
MLKEEATSGYNLLVRFRSVIRDEYLDLLGRQMDLEISQNSLGFDKFEKRQFVSGRSEKRVLTVGHKAAIIRTCAGCQ